jgi:hypothetical protein
MAEGKVVVSPPGGGANIRALELTVKQQDGTFATVEVQAVALVDPNGNFIDPKFDQLVQLTQTTNALLRALITVLQAGIEPKILLDETMFLEQPLAI